MEKKILYLFTDGAASSQEDGSFECGSGFVIATRENSNLVKSGKYLGKATNQIAELTAIHDGLKSIS